MKQAHILKLKDKLVYVRSAPLSKTIECWETQFRTIASVRNQWELNVKSEHPVQTRQKIAEVRQDVARSPRRTTAKESNNSGSKIRLCISYSLRILIYTHILSILFDQDRYGCVEICHWFLQKFPANPGLPLRSPHIGALTKNTVIHLILHQYSHGSTNTVQTNSKTCFNQDSWFRERWVSLFGHNVRRPENSG